MQIADNRHRRERYTSVHGEANEKIFRSEWRILGRFPAGFSSLSRGAVREADEKSKENPIVWTALITER